MGENTELWKKLVLTDDEKEGLQVEKILTREANEKGKFGLMGKVLTCQPFNQGSRYREPYRWSVGTGMVSFHTVPTHGTA